MGYTATKNIKHKIICSYKEKCKDYNEWLRSFETNKCLKCTNNTYKEQKEEKESYYSEPVVYTIIKAIAFFIISIAVLGVVLG